jgi:thiosulfate reductase cytochrome b subunit
MPHGRVRPVPPREGRRAPACTDCHGGTAAFDDAARDVKASVHVEMGDPDFGCANCHSPHYFLPVSRLPGPERSFALVNRACNECHAAGDTPEARKASLEELALKHERFPHEMVHLQRVGCVACHTPTDKDTVHLVLPKSKALGECVMCHSGQSLLAAKFDEYLAKKERAEKGWLNAALYNNAYLTGATRHRWLDWGTFLLTALTLAGIGIHALGRWFSAISGGLEKMSGTRAYPLWLRVWHWANATLFLTLLVTGLRMHYSAPAFPPIDFRVSHLVHNVAGILLTLLYLLYILGNLFLGNGRYYRIVSGDISPGLMVQAGYYINGIFLGRPHPFPHGPDRKFNPLQKLIYLAVIFLFFPASILTGWGLFVPDKLPQGVLGMPSFAFWPSPTPTSTSSFPSS